MATARKKPRKASKAKAPKFGIYLIDRKLLPLQPKRRLGSVDEVAAYIDGWFKDDEDRPSYMVPVAVLEKGGAK